MSSKSAQTVSSTDHRTIEADRFERAVVEPMDAERVADRFYEVVSTDSDTYEVDLESGACTCPDAQYRGEQYVCKHAIRAALVEAVANTGSSELVARVAGYARDPEHGCPTGSAGCVGPLAGHGVIPCPTCCDALRSPGVSEWEIWLAVARRDYERERGRKEAR